MAQMSADVVAVWVSGTTGPASRSWQGLLGEDERLVGAIGSPAVGLEGFIRTYEQAQAAFRLVTASRGGSQVAAYTQVAALIFLVDDPARSHRWIAATLGRLAAAGRDIEQVRHTLHLWLAAGENVSAVAKELYMHRNTVNYRVGRAVALLPDGLDGHRTEVALALEFVKWVPDVITEVD